MKYKMIIFFLILIVQYTYAQREVTVPPERVGILNEYILGDTIEGGDRFDPNTVYFLERGGIYKVTGEIRNPGYTLTIKASPGEGPMPIIMPTPLTGGESSRPFTIQGDFNLDGVYVTCYNDRGGFRSRIIRVNVEGVKVTLRNCWFDGAAQSVVRFDTDNSSVLMENNIISHIGNAGNPNNGRVVDFRKSGDSIVFRNNTIYNITSRLMRVSGGFAVDYAEFQYNTLINSGQIIADLEQTVTAKFQDNLFINPGFVGSTRGGSMIAYDALAKPELFPVDQNIAIFNNWFYYQPHVLNVWADSITHQRFYDSDMYPFMIDPSGQPMDSLTLAEDYTFTGIVDLRNAPRISESVLYGMIFDVLYAPNPDQGSSPNWDFTQSWFFQLVSSNLPTTWEFPYNFSYGITEAAATAATDGGQLGSRMWELEDFGIVLGIDPKIKNKIFYPNPVDSYINIYPTIEARSISIVDMKGTKVLEGSVISGSVDLSMLNKGMYVSIISDYSGNRFKNLLLKK